MGKHPTQDIASVERRLVADSGRIERGFDADDSGHKTGGRLRYSAASLMISIRAVPTVMAETPPSRTSAARPDGGASSAVKLPAHRSQGPLPCPTARTVARRRHRNVGSAGVGEWSL